MFITKFLDWLSEKETIKEAHGSGVPQIDMQTDQDIATGDWKAELFQLASKWAVLPEGPAKKIAKQQVDDYAAELIGMGNSTNEVYRILSQAMYAKKGEFMRAAAGNETARGQLRRSAGTEEDMYNNRVKYRRSNRGNF